jgi:hypothetical protein
MIPCRLFPGHPAALFGALLRSISRNPNILRRYMLSALFVTVISTALSGVASLELHKLDYDASSIDRLSSTLGLFSGRWSTARLSVARYGLAATSLPSQGLALFGGGQGAICASSLQYGALLMLPFTKKAIK